MEAEEDELLEISCQDLNKTDGKEVKILWERSVGERMILRWEWIANNGSLGDDPRMSLEKFVKKLKTELIWWGLDKQIRAWTWSDDDGTIKYLFKFTKNWECYADY